MKYEISNEDLLMKYRNEKIAYKRDYYAQKLYEQTKKIMYSNLGSFIRKGYKIDDIAEAEGRMIEAWYDAVRYCDVNKAKFSTYLTKCVNRRIYKYIKNDQFTKKHVHANTLARNEGTYESESYTGGSENEILSSITNLNGGENPYPDILLKILIQDSLLELKKQDQSYFEVIDMAYIKGYTQNRISMELGLSQPQISRRISKALEILKAIIGEDDLMNWGIKYVK